MGFMQFLIHNLFTSAAADVDELPTMERKAVSRIDDTRFEKHSMYLFSSVTVTDKDKGEKVELQHPQAIQGG